MTPHQRLIDFLDSTSSRYRLVAHVPAGKSFEVAAARGTEVGQGAKALVCVGPKCDGGEVSVLAVIPADRQLNLSFLAACVGAKKLRLASADQALELTGCVFGAIAPFSFRNDLLLVLDPELTNRYAEIAFNASCLDRSVILDAQDYLRIANPKLHSVSI